MAKASAKAKTLAGALPKLKMDIQKLMYDAAYSSFMTVRTGDADTIPVIQSKLDAQLDAAAVNYARRFSRAVAQPLSTAIYEFVKEIGINLINPSTLMSTSIVSPSPVTGTVPMTGFRVE